MDMTQEKWENPSMLSPEIKAFAKNEFAQYLRTIKDAAMAEKMSLVSGNLVRTVAGFTVGQAA